MSDEKIKQSEHSCCDVPALGETSICKECGNKGITVKEITLKSLVKESKLEGIKNFTGFYFCQTPPCNVVYFNNEQNVYLHKEDVRVRVGIKENEDPIPVCYCFGWTQGRIFNQIKEQGYSTAVQEITAKVKAKECSCEINNPSGKCCLGEVSKVVKRGIELYGKNQKEKLKRSKLRELPIVGAIISGIVASACCIGPVVLSVLGVSGAGLFSKFESYRSYFIGVTVVLLGAAFYLTYRNKEVICEDGTCKIKSAGRWNKIALWCATMLVAFFLAFPYLKPYFALSDSSFVSTQAVRNITEVIIPVGGMTCSGCEFNIENAVKKLDGIIQVKADHQKGEVYIKFEKEKVIVEKILEAINNTGYKATKP